MKKIFFFLLFVTLCVPLGVAAHAYLWLHRSVIRTSTLVEVQGGSGVSQIARTLAREGVISHPLYFELLATRQGVGHKLKAGTYRFDPGAGPLEILDKIVKGQVEIIEVTIPEGFNIWQVADRLAEAFPATPKAKWLDAMRHPSPSLSLPREARTVEGYLFPDTYKLRPKATPEEVIALMVAGWRKHMTPDIIRQGHDRGLSVHEIVTLASCIEKETGVGAERPRIAGIFYARLKRHIRLQTDPSVIYGIWERYDGKLHKKDLLEPNPYNSYLNPGLPPGPIANPGVASIVAAVNPLDTGELYFVGKGDGTHQFSKTLEEHNRAFYLYQIKPSRK